MPFSRTRGTNLIFFSISQIPKSQIPRKKKKEKKLKERNVTQRYLSIYRSIYGSNIGGWYGGVSTMNSNYVENVGAEEQRRVNSAVQARIEAMFASVEAESGTPEECVAAILPVNIHIDYFPL